MIYTYIYIYTPTHSRTHTHTHIHKDTDTESRMTTVQLAEHYRICSGQEMRDGAVRRQLYVVVPPHLAAWPL